MVPFSLLELRTAARGLVRAPTVAISAIVCLALGIGATTAIASAINRAILQSLPFRDPDQLVAVVRTTLQSVPNYLNLAQCTRRL